MTGLEGITGIAGNLSVRRSILMGHYDAPLRHRHPGSKPLAGESAPRLRFPV
jgi:hypothetical protein